MIFRIFRISSTFGLRDLKSPLSLNLSRVLVLFPSWSYQLSSLIRGVIRSMCSVLVVSNHELCLTINSSTGPPKLTPKPRLRVLAQLTPHENIYTIPNILTFSRLIAAPVIGYLVLHDYHAWAVGLFAYAGITDLVDGYIARRWNLQTVVGTVIDPMADKTLMTILTVCLAIKGALPGSLNIRLLPQTYMSQANNLLRLQYGWQSSFWDATLDLE